VKIVDANVLIYATNEDSVHHAVAHRWLDEALTSNETVGFAWVVLLAFVRLTTRRGLMPQPLSVSQASDSVDAWLSRPNAIVPAPTHRHHVVLRDLLERTGTTGNLTTDAHLASLALEHGATICTFDSDFTRFPGVRWTTPEPAHDPESARPES
jgi:toxin-antitoxin system PIN domain toxin